MSDMTGLDWVLEDVRGERQRQDEKWGEPKRQPDGTGPNVEPAMPLAVGYDWEALTYSELEREAKSTTDWHATSSRHEVTFADILLEEVFEALASDDPKSLREELIQVAAVAVKWVEVLDRESSESSS